MEYAGRAVTTLKWLHLTDLHIGMQDYGHWPQIRRLLLEDLKRVTAKHGPWDVVVFTGDLAFSGQEEQYRKLDKELDDLWNAISKDGRAPILLAVPGNHDLNRTAVYDRDAAALKDPEIREKVWSSPQHGLVTAIGSWFSAYTAWWERCPYRPKQNLQTGLLPGEFAFVLEKEGVRFGFAGLNTAWGDPAGKAGAGDLHVDGRQLHPACQDDLARWTSECHAAFLLTHHPPVWLSQRARERYNEDIAPAGQFFAHFCGHLHEAEHDQRSQGAGQERRIWQASSMFGMDWFLEGGSKRSARRHGYTAGQAHIAGGELELIQWPRVACKMQDGSWQVTNDTSFKLENDIANTPAIVAEMRRSVPVMVALSPPAAPVHEREVHSWRDAVAKSSLWELLQDDIHAELAGDVADACQQIWLESRQESDAGDDPWLDDVYPMRLIARLEAFASKGTLDGPTTLLLLVAPCIYQALLAGGTSWMARANLEDLTDTSSSQEPRNTLEQVLRRRPDLARRARSLQGVKQQAAVWWLVHEALQRSPVLWSETPKLPASQSLYRRIQERCAAREGIGWAQMVDLARFVAIDPDALDSRHPIALRYLLHVAAWAALEPRRVHDAAVTELGIDDASHLEELLAALAESGWERRKDGDVLHWECQLPAVDYVLRDLIERGDAFLQRVHEQRISGSAWDMLDALPPRLSTAGLRVGLDGDGRPRYRLPHVRFTLEHNRIRTLLMGERLYGDPALAIRELYQNALDACRYRKARQTYLERQGEWYEASYEGRIVFRQDQDEHGRLYIECMDNGVGMTEANLARTFAVAGRRFSDAPEFVEEQAAWNRCNPPIELYPNSQFGIGVLSYFMLADEVEVVTRRFQRDGSRGTLLQVRIQGGSGLFHVREIPDDAALADSGTRIRLYLREGLEVPRGENGLAKTSCHTTLGKLLWFAEFATELHEQGRESLYWPAGKLAPGGCQVSEAEYGDTGSPDFWWHLGVGAEDAHLLLADGLLTPQSEKYSKSRRAINRSVCVINLHGPHFPELNLSRSEIVGWDHSHCEQLMLEHADSLAQWSGVSLGFLSALDGEIGGQLARVAYQVLHDVDAQVTIASPCPVKVRLRNVGMYAEDGGLFNEKEGNTLHIFRPRNALESVRAWRCLVWKAEIRGKELGGDVRFVGEPADRDLHRWRELKDLVAEPGDRYWFGGWSSGAIPIMNAVVKAHRDGQSTTECVRRIAKFSPLGLRIAPGCQDAESLDKCHLEEDDFRILSRDLDGRAPWFRRVISAVHVLNASRDLQVPVATITGRIRLLAPPLGLRLDFDEELIASLQLDEKDWCLISRDGDGAPPWLSGLVPRLHVLCAAHHIGWKPSRAVARLLELAGPLGFEVDTSYEYVSLDDLTLEDQEYELLRNLRQSRSLLSWSRAHLEFNNAEDASRASNLLRRLLVFGLFESGTRLHRFVSKFSARDELDLFVQENKKWYRAVNYRHSLNDGDDSDYHHVSELWVLSDYAEKYEKSLSVAAEAVCATGLISEDLHAAIRASDLDGLPFPETSFDLMRCIALATRFEPQYLMDEIMAEARCRLYWLSDDEVETQLAHIQPLIDYARKVAPLTS